MSRSATPSRIFRRTTKTKTCSLLPIQEKDHAKHCRHHQITAVFTHEAAGTPLAEKLDPDDCSNTQKQIQGGEETDDSLLFVLCAQASSMSIMRITAQSSCSTRTKPHISARLRMFSSRIWQVQRRNTAVINRCPGRQPVSLRRESSPMTAAATASQTKRATCGSP